MTYFMFVIGVWRCCVFFFLGGGVCVCVGGVVDDFFFIGYLLHIGSCRRLGY